MISLREECRLRVFENRMLRRILGTKRDESGEWRRLHNEELNTNVLDIAKQKEFLEHFE